MDERRRDVEHNGSSTNPLQGANLRNGAGYTRITPRNQQRSYRSSENNHRRSDVNLPNIRFSTHQQTNNTAQSSPINANRHPSDSPSNIFPHQGAVASNIGAGAMMSIRNSTARNATNRLQLLPRSTSLNNTSSTSDPRSKNQSSHSPPRRHNRRRGINSYNASTSDVGRVVVTRTMVMPADEEADTDLHPSHHPPPRRAGSSVDEVVPPVHLNVGGRYGGGVSGLGTEDQPYELLNDTEVVDIEESVAQSVTRDEEIARQLQQEEWERASTPLTAGHRNPSRLQFLQAVHGAVGDNRPGEVPYRRTRRAMQLPVLGNSRGSLPRAALQLPDLLDIFHPEIMEIIMGNGYLFADGNDHNDYEALLEMGDQIGAVSRGMSQSDINRIPSKRHRRTTSSSTDGAGASASVPQQCSICLSEFEVGDAKRILPCQHELHKDCIDQWLKSNATCPVCRKDVREGRE